MVGFMALRAAVRALLAILSVAAAAIPAAAAPVHFVHTPEAFERIALADVDRDGDVDIVAARRDGALVVWRNAGHGRFARVAPQRDAQHIVARESRITRVDDADDGWQWGDDRHDAAMPRAPAVAGDVPIAAVRATTPVYVRPSGFRRFSGRAPPVL